MIKKKAKYCAVEFKAKVALEAIYCDLTVNKISAKYGFMPLKLIDGNKKCYPRLKRALRVKSKKLIAVNKN